MHVFWIFVLNTTHLLFAIRLEAQTTRSLCITFGIVSPIWFYSTRPLRHFVLTPLENWPTLLCPSVLYVFESHVRVILYFDIWSDDSSIIHKSSHVYRVESFNNLLHMIWRRFNAANWTTFPKLLKNIGLKQRVGKFIVAKLTWGGVNLLTLRDYSIRPPLSQICVTQVYFLEQRGK